MLKHAFPGAIILLSLSLLLQSCSGLANGPDAALKRFDQAHSDWSSEVSATGQNKKSRQEIDEKARKMFELQEQTDKEITAAGTSAIPALLANLHNPNVAVICKQHLAFLGPPATDACIEWVKKHPEDANNLAPVFAVHGASAGDKLVAMTQGSEAERALAAKLLAYKFRDGHTGYRLAHHEEMSGTSEKTLIAAIKNENVPETKKDLIAALRNFDNADEQSLQAISNLIESDQSEDIRIEAINVLGGWLPNAAPSSEAQIISTLEKCFTSDDSAEVRMNAVQALASAKSINPQVLAILRNAENTERSNKVRLMVLKTLASLVARDEHYLPDLVQELNDPAGLGDGLQNVIAAGPKAKSVESILLEIEDPALWAQQLAALNAIGSDSPQFVELVSRALELSDRSGTDSQVKYAAVACMKRLGPKTAAAAMPALKALAAASKVPGSAEAQKCLDDWGLAAVPSNVGAAPSKNVSPAPLMPTRSK